MFFIDKTENVIYIKLAFHLKVERRFVFLNERLNRIAKAFNILLHSKKIRWIAKENTRNLGFLVFLFVIFLKDFICNCYNYISIINMKSQCLVKKFFKTLALFGKIGYNNKVLKRTEKSRNKSYSLLVPKVHK